ncbi:Protein cereblon [Frankliniella fusca]|uniref:Protein cereblon n=1 Tax=Frankliniella fusca TaxID=407009 RepID=A0AAE1H3G7_9NEOP|nr:Protein cereblon [Frankliniella fusca]
MEADDGRSSDDSDWSYDGPDLEEFYVPTGDENPPAPSLSTSDASEQTFDPALPMQHAYLGTDLTVLHGRTLLDDDDGSSYWLPLLPQINVVLVPGQTLPLSVSSIDYQPTVQMIQRALDGNKIFATVCMLKNENMTEFYHADVGTTAEIYEVQRGGDNVSMRIKAIGRQRFKLLETKADPDGLFPVARVRILPEITLPYPMSGNAFQCLNKYRTKVNDDVKETKKRQRLLSSDSVTSAWPSWVYEQYDPQVLVKRMKRPYLIIAVWCLFCFIAACQIPSDPVELSFWVARSLPVNDATRLIPLRMNCAIQRLRWELTTLDKPSILCCNHCSQTIASQQDVFSMSAEGLQGTYVNSHGFVHDTITIRKATGVLLQNRPPSTEFSWFPGYGWTIAACSRCHRHVGWKFTATNPTTIPDKFWGLCRRSLNSRQVKELFPKE